MTSQSTFSDRESPVPPPVHAPSVEVGFDPSDVLPLRRPPLRDDCVMHGEDPLAGAEPNVVVTQAAVRQIQAHCQSNLGAEVGGVLLGEAYQYNNQIYVEIAAAIPAINADHGPVHFTFTADVWRQIHRDREQYPDLDVVGWFHTHPDLGVFFSADDEVVHAAAFTQPWHVALVVDPVRHEASFFGWWNGQITAFDGFYELIPLAGEDGSVPRSIIDWAIRIDHSAMRTYADLLPHYGQSAAAANALTWSNPRVAFVVAVMGLITGVAALIIVLMRTSNG